MLTHSAGIGPACTALHAVCESALIYCSTNMKKAHIHYEPVHYSKAASHKQHAKPQT